MNKILDSNFKTRTATALVLGSLFLFCLLYSQTTAECILYIISCGMLLEWFNMCNPNKPYLLLGFPIILIPILSLLELIYFSAHYRHILILYFSLIWTVDTFAMLCGRFLEGPKIAEIISPKKTWSGFICGVLSAPVVVITVSVLLNLSFNSFALMFGSIVFAILSQISDLFISIFKRKFAIKDSGYIIPGHGGVLDRFDSTILTAPMLLFCVMYFNYV